MYHHLGYRKELLYRLDLILNAQEDINAAITAVTELVADIQARIGDLADDLSAWQNSQPASVDTSGLTPVIEQVAQVQAALDAQVASVTSALTPPPATGV